MRELTQPTLVIENLVKCYRRGVRANDDVTLQASAGEVVGLLGHNGAGKTTLINQVVGLVRPTSGTIRVAGCDPVSEPGKARRMVSLMPQSHVPLAGVTPRQAIETLAQIRGASKRDARRRAADLLAALELGQWADTRGERLSGGVRRLAAFGMAACVPGHVVMLDEPTNDVDPARRRLLWAQIRRIADEGCAVLLVTHNVVEAERSIDRLFILNAGRVVAAGTPAELRSRVRGDFRLELTFSAADRLPDLPDRIRPAGDQLRASRRLTVPLNTDSVADALAWAMHLQETNQVDEFALVPVSLENVYLEATNSRHKPAMQEESDDASLAT
jgi:ABC-2 type transport system ATP-binding protein